MDIAPEVPPDQPPVDEQGRRLNQIHFADESPVVLRIPPGVWHADQNTGTTEAIVVNFPTRPYDRAEPDEYRTDPHEGEIPFDFTLRDG
jgi:dTDP-4-dehydrorhamnose 3,5-epimerase